MKCVFNRITAAIAKAAVPTSQKPVSQKLATWIVLVGCSCALMACTSNPESANTSGDVQVLAPSPDVNTGHYSLKILELSGLSNLQEVSGRFARFFFSPSISDGHLQGSAAKGRFLKSSKGYFIPVDDLSQQMVVIYSHLQQLAHLDEEVGAAGVNKWPRDIGVGVRVGGGVSNNAFYDGKTDSMLFVPYTEQELPIAENGGILAHEHFHSLFFKLVLKNLAEEASVHDRVLFLQQAGIKDLDSRTGRTGRAEQVVRDGEDSPLVSSEEIALHEYYHTTLLRGMNEGLADFWGWMYTGNPDFIATSLPSEASARSLNVEQIESASKLLKSRDIKNSVGIYLSYDSTENVKLYLTGYAYQIGTSFSRMMKRLADIVASSRGLDDQKARRQVATWLVKALPSLRIDIQKIQDGSYYDPSQFVDSLVTVVPDLRKEECQFLVEAFNSTLDSGSKKRSCKQDPQWKMVTE